MKPLTATSAWLSTLDALLQYGTTISPRGKETYENLHYTLSFDLRYPIIRVPARRLSYRFLAAEALWINNGDDRVSTIAPYNPNIAQFSDDGQQFFGAYGPRVEEQFAGVVLALFNDPATRQAVMMLWRPNPPKTKDVPCTLALTFNVRDDRLNCHAFMRSSDAWLGLPYDGFTFSTIAYRVACGLNRINRDVGRTWRVGLGRLYLSAVSSHLYAQNKDAARECVLSRGEKPDYDDAAGEWLDKTVREGHWAAITDELVVCRDKLVIASKWRIRP